LSTPKTLKIPTARVFEPLLQPARYKGVYGGRGSGKSHFFGELLVETCQAERGTLAVCIREAQRTLAQSSKRLIEGKIASLGLGRGFKPFNDKIETPGDGLIIFRGMQDHTAESMKSLEGFRIAWIDEAQTLSARSLALLRPTIRAANSEVWASWNPRRKSDAIDDFLRTRKPEGAIVVSANWRDNPWFPSVLEEERQLDLALYPDRYEHIWEGDYVRAFEGAYFAQLLNEARAQGRIGKVAADPLLPLRAFIDIGGAGATADAFTMWLVQWVGTEICARRRLRSECCRQPAWLRRLAEGHGGPRSECGARFAANARGHRGQEASLRAVPSIETDATFAEEPVERLDRRVRCLHFRSPIQKEMNHVDFLRSRHVCRRFCGVLVLQGQNCASRQRRRGLCQGAREQSRGVEGFALMFRELKVICLHSLTVAWGYVLAIAGAAMTAIDNIDDALGDPNLRDQINNAIGDTRVAGRILLGISIVTILARLRSLRKAG